MKRKFQKKELALLGIYLIIGITTIFVVSYSPLIGTRLMFFSTLTIIIFSLYIARKIYCDIHFKSYVLKIIFSVWLMVFFVLSSLISFNSNKIFNNLYVEIQEKSKISKHVNLDEKLDYSKNNYPKFNRRVLFENGTEYIDKNPSENSAEEKNLIIFFKLKSLSISKD